MAGEIRSLNLLGVEELGRQGISIILKTVAIASIFIQKGHGKYRKDSCAFLRHSNGTNERDTRSVEFSGYTLQ